MRSEPLNWILLQRKMCEMQQAQIESNTQWDASHLHLTDEDTSLFKLACDLKEAACKMTEEEEERPLAPSLAHQLDLQQVRELINYC